jgi:hypothetical protein
MPKECQSSKSDSEIEDPELFQGKVQNDIPRHAELVSAFYLCFGFDLTLEL